MIELYTEGTLCESLEQCLKQQQEDAPEWLQPEEASVLALLEGQVRREADQIKAA